MTGDLGSFLKDRVAIDPRSLAALRILVGCFACLTCLFRLQDLGAHYTDGGCFPIDTRLQEISENGYHGTWSLMFLDGSAVFNGTLLALGVLTGILLAIGWRTKTATLACWLLIASFRTRNPHVGDGGDSMLAVLLFWMIFLPCGITWSVDRVREAKNGRRMAPDLPVATAGTAALLLQICLIYWFAAIFKFNSSWRIDGTALADALAIESLARPVARWVLRFPLLLQLLSHSVLLVEEIGPFLALGFAHRSKGRLFGALSMMSLHLGIATFFSLGAFPWIAFSAWVVFLPPFAWDYLQSRGKILASTVPLIRGGRSRTPLYPPKKFSGSYSRYRLHFLQAVPLIPLLLVIWWNLATLPLKRGNIWIPESVRFTVFALQLNQHWGFFAPEVNTRDGWYVTAAKLDDGSVVDLLRNGVPVAWEKPTRISRSYGNKRWREYLTHVFHHRKPELVDAYASWLRSRWDADHPDNETTDLEIFFMLEDSRFPEDGISRVKMFPITNINEFGQAVYEGDERRNRNDAERKAESSRSVHQAVGE